jgi:hypothetical protein
MVGGELLIASGYDATVDVPDRAGDPAVLVIGSEWASV